MRITGVESTELFTGTQQRPVQIVRVTVLADETDAAGGADAVSGSAAKAGAVAISVRVEGPTVSTPRPTALTVARNGGPHVVEVGVELAAPVAEGSRRRATVIAEHAGARAEASAEIIAAVPGWTMWMVSHFHYDPVWWNTQGQFTESRLLLPDEDGKLPEFRTAFELVGLHLDMARDDPDYKFVLAEIDYLKPYFDAHPQRRADMKRLLGEGRLELVGGNYNEANTNLTCAEATIRNAVYGIGYQRDVLGADPRTAWMLDVFGHDPSYPSLMAAAGLTATAWARGPFHQWGPRGTVGDNTRMQFRSEFEWMSPDGSGLLTAYMPNHYGAGWAMERRGALAAAEREAYDQFLSLKPVAATRNVLLPVGADHVIPSRWCTQVHRDWNARYVWPRFVTALPREFFSAVRADAADRDVMLTPQTRDMNPLYPGKDVSYIDTKQAQRAAETAVMDGERLATLAWLHGAPYPDAALDKAWRQLIYGGHHDAITGTESDQVYLDLLGGWREAYERGDGVRRDAARHLASLADTTPPGSPTQPGQPAQPDQPTQPDQPDRAVAEGSPAARAIVVLNTLAATRDGLATITLRRERPGVGWLELRDSDGARVPALADGVRRHPDGTLAEVTLTFRASNVPGLGYRTYWARPAQLAPPDQAGWTPAAGTVIENLAYLVEADPNRGGGLARVLDKRADIELITAGGVGNELVLQEEYDYHPRWTEGPWLLTPKGAGVGSATMTAEVQAQRCPIGGRLVARWTREDLAVTQETLLWDGARRLEFRTHVDGSIGHDRLLRVRFPLNVPGGLPIYETAAAVIGRPFGPTDIDVAQHWFTLDNPAYTWFGLGGTARVLVTGGGGARWAEALGVAEVISPMSLNGSRGANHPGASGGSRWVGPPEQHSLNGCRGAVRRLIAALARQGVTATCSAADGPRYGAIDLDSNLPDARISIGGPDLNSFTAQVLSAADPAYAKELAQRLADDGAARVWVPAAKSRAEAFVPGADVRGARDLPVLIVAGADLAATVNALADGLHDGEIAAVTAGLAGPVIAAPLAEWSAGLLNRGTPGCVATTDGGLAISLMRSCSGWPSGVWIDEPRRTAPDGSSFSWQHWTHTFDYALVSGHGSWREVGLSCAGQDYNHPLLSCETHVHTGSLPGAASLLAIEAPDNVTLSALKRGGYPAATGSPGHYGPARADAITVRLREASGRPARARLSVPPQAGASIGAARLTNLLEDEDGAALETEGDAVLASLPPYGTMTLLATPAKPSRAGAAGSSPATEPAQPVFTRYWLHGKGPAPAGYLPTAVHISPARSAIPGGGERGAVPVPLRVAVATGAAPAAGSVELDVPEGLVADPHGPLRYDLPAGGHAGWDVAVRATGAPGRYFVAAWIRDAAGQRLEDAAMVAVGERPAPRLDTPLDTLLPLLEADQRATAAELDVALSPGSLTLAPGGRGELVARLASGARSRIRGEAQLLSPFGTWELITPWTQGFAVDPGGEATVRYEVAAPAAARPGAGWWALVKVCYFGRVRYTAAVPVSIAV